MRQIGRLQEESQARMLGDYLYAQGIENQVDEGSGGDWEIWALDDANVERAGALFEQFRRHPDDPMYAAAGREAMKKREEDREAQAPRRGRVIDGRTVFYRPPVGLGWLTLALIVISVAVSIVTRLGDDDRFVRPLAIVQYHERDGYITWDPSLVEIRHGQVWRLFTPMFIHLNLLHILFNMLWLKDLGGMIEARKGWRTLLALVLVIAAVSNIAQFLGKGPMFGGMSGVVYGLFGYIWMQGRFNPPADLTLDPQTVMMMLVWFVLCLAGVIPDVANWAHGVGLGAGVAWGYAAATLARRRP